MLCDWGWGDPDQCNTAVALARTTRIAYLCGESHQSTVSARRFLPPQRHPAVELDGPAKSGRIGASGLSDKERLLELSREATFLSKPRARQCERSEH